MTLPISYLRINSDVQAIEEQKELQVQETIKEKDVLFDYEAGKFYYDGLEPRKIYNKVEIIKEWIKKLFYTERDRWNVHIKDIGYPFGLNIYKYVGQQLYPNTDLIELIKDDIYNSLKNHKDIEEIHCLQLIQIDDKMYCGFIVELKESAFEVEEVIKVE